jgi:hypothetical protein
MQAGPVESPSMASADANAEDHVTHAELEAALEALREPGRFRDAERLVSAAAPGLHRVLLEALASGGWGAEDDVREIDRAIGQEPAAARAALLGLLGEQSRISMLVGVAVGIELARELELIGPGEPELPVTKHGNAHGGPR